MHCREHKQTTLQHRTTAQTSRGQKRHARAAYCCGRLLYWRLSFVIRHHRLPLSPRAVCMCLGVSRAPLKTIIWMIRTMVTWSRCPILDLKARVRSFADVMSDIFSTFFFNLILVSRSTQPRRHRQPTAHQQCRPRATYNQLTTTLYTPAAAASRAGSNITRVRQFVRAVLLWLPSYSVVAFFIE